MLTFSSAHVCEGIVATHIYYVADAGLFVIIFIVVDVSLVLLGLVTVAIVLVNRKEKHWKPGKSK